MLHMVWLVEQLVRTVLQVQPVDVARSAPLATVMGTQCRIWKPSTRHFVYKEGKRDGLFLICAVTAFIQQSLRDGASVRQATSSRNWYRLRRNSN